jgi:hypothetical protein
MSIQKKSLISALKTTKKANVASAAAKEEGNAVRTAAISRQAGVSRQAGITRQGAAQRLASLKKK